MMKHPLPNGMWLSCPTRRQSRIEHWYRRAAEACRSVGPEDAAFAVAAVIGLGGTLWLAGVVLAWYLR